MMKATNKKNNTTAFVVTTILCLLPIVLGAYFYQELPGKIPMKWYADGTTGQYMPKEMTIFGMPAAMAALNALVHFGLNTDPKTGNIAKKSKAIGKWICPLMSLILVSSSIFWALGSKVPVDTIVFLLIGIVFIAAGNYMPKTRRNYTSGIKIPWTLNSDENWRRTHHLAAFLWILGGVFMIVTGFIHTEALVYVALVFLLFMAAIPVLYSYLLFRKGI